MTGCVSGRIILFLFPGISGSALRVFLLLALRAISLISGRLLSCHFFCLLVFPGIGPCGRAVKKAVGVCREPVFFYFFSLRVQRGDFKSHSRHLPLGVGVELADGKIAPHDLVFDRGIRMVCEIHYSIVFSDREPDRLRSFDQVAFRGTHFLNPVNSVGQRADLRLHFALFIRFQSESLGARKHFLSPGIYRLVAVIKNTENGAFQSCAPQRAAAACLKIQLTGFYAAEDQPVLAPDRHNFRKGDHLRLMNLLIRKIAGRCAGFTNIVCAAGKHLDHIGCPVSPDDKSACCRPLFFSVFFRFVQSIDGTLDRLCIRFLLVLFLGRILDQCNLSFFGFFCGINGGHIICCHREIIGLYIQLESG